MRALNIALFVNPPAPFEVAGLNLGWGDLLGLVWIAVTLGLDGAGMIAQLRQLAREEPPTAKDG